MKILVVGQGGREHALTWKLAQSPLVDRVFCAPGNAGTEIDGENVDISSTDTQRLIAFAKHEQISLTVVGPEAPLVSGLVDAFEAENLLVFGPRASAARLEGSKVFSKRLMRQANVPTADFEVFESPDAAIRYIREREQDQFVIKADGLAAGKGVSVCSSKDEAEAAVAEMMVSRSFGEAGDRILIEETLEGEEASILAVVDGTTIMPLEVSQDHKPAGDGDTGPNTGGMGAYSPAPLVDEAMLDRIIEKIFLPTVHTLKREGNSFRGVLYAGLMMTPQGPKVLEFNVRFGDPEAQPVLMRLQSDLAEPLLAAAEGKLKHAASPVWDSRPSVCVVMAADGYPGSYEKGRPIRGLEEAARLADVKVFHAGTRRDGDQIVTDGGRVLGVTALGESIAKAKYNAYQAVKTIRWDGAWCRKDISDKAREQ